MPGTSYYIINGITIYRIVASLILVFLIVTNRPEIFRWFLAVSFFTDAIDGFLARKFQVASVLGAKLDSIGDDLTVLLGAIGLFVFKYEFIKEQLPWLLLLLLLFIIQAGSALLKYKTFTSFHTYMAKLAAVAQGCFLILAFFLKEPSLFLFYLAITLTALDLIEETIIVYILPRPSQNVKGLYWVMREQKAEA